MQISYPVPEGLLDEVCDSQGNLRPIYNDVSRQFAEYDQEGFHKLHTYAKDYLKNQGISFLVYSNKTGTHQEDTFPIDLMPRLIDANEWQSLEAGMLQRNKAINLFLKDIYNKQSILKDKVVPYDLVLSADGYLREMVDFIPPGDIYNHVCGTDLIKDAQGVWRVLEDNVRNPSGVSYVITNRQILKIIAGDLLKSSEILPVGVYPEALHQMLDSVSHHKQNPVIAVHTPGIYNAAYFEHGFLARNMGAHLVEGRDMFVDQNEVYLKTTKGQQKIHVIYRRIDDLYLDPMAFNPDSVLGVPGLFQAYRSGNVTIANAPGCGAADDKAVYAYMPRIIKYYLDEDPIIPNVETFFCDNDAHMSHIKENMKSMVIKPVNMSGGYGIVMGHQMTQAEMDAQYLKLKHNPRDYIAQPTIQLSTHATYIESEKAFKPRHIDLRMFTLMGDQYEYVLKGGLTRVALREGSLIVNSSQGGGSKDTWILSK